MLAALCSMFWPVVTTGNQYQWMQYQLMFLMFCYLLLVAALNWQLQSCQSFFLCNLVDCVAQCFPSLDVPVV
jgi:hypothetical protein